VIFSATPGNVCGRFWSIVDGAFHNFKFNIFIHLDSSSLMYEDKAFLFAFFHVETWSCNMLEKSSTILCKVSWVDISGTIPLLGRYPFSSNTRINRVSLEKKRHLICYGQIPLDNMPSTIHENFSAGARCVDLKVHHPLGCGSTLC